MREAEGRQPCGRVDLVTATVSDLLRRSSVIPQAVRLHDQPELRPEEVGAEVVHPCASPGCRQADGADQPEEDPLEFGVGEPECASVEDPAQRRNPALPAHPIEPQAKRFRIDEIELVCFVDCGFERSGFESRRKVDLRSNRARDRDAEPSLQFARVERTAAVKTDAVNGSIERRRDRDLNGTPTRRTNAPQLRRGLVADHGLRPTGEHGCHAPTRHVQLWSAHNEHPSMNGMQTPGRDPMPNGMSRIAKFQELSAGDQPVLLTGDAPRR